METQLCTWLSGQVLKPQTCCGHCYIVGTALCPKYCTCLIFRVSFPPPPVLGTRVGTKKGM